METPQARESYSPRQAAPDPYGSPQGGPDAAPPRAVSRSPIDGGSGSGGPPTPVPRPFPVDYREQETFTVRVAPGFAGVVVVMPEGLAEVIEVEGQDKKTKMKLRFRIALFVGRAVGAATFVPRGRGMMIIDIPDGFSVSPETLTEVVDAEWRKGSGRPPPSGGVGGSP
jgi:hypothetical protein